MQTWFVHAAIFLLMMGLSSLTLFAVNRPQKSTVVTPYAQLLPFDTVWASVPLFGEQSSRPKWIGSVSSPLAGVRVAIEPQLDAAVVPQR